MRPVHLLIAGFTLCVATATPAAAQSLAEPKTITVTPFVSTSFGTSQNLGSSLGIGAAVGYDWTSTLGVEAEFGRVFDVAGDDDNLDYKLTTMNANVVYHFDMKRLTPYATLGLGWQRSNPDSADPETLALYPGSSTEVAWNFGGGVKVPVYAGRILARADLRRFQVNDLGPDHWRLYGGLTVWIKR
ncbi:MAG: outer membrane beta-barrel protein [Vicinamibacterales bacterium]